MNRITSNPEHGCVTIFKRKLLQLIAELRLIPGTEEQVKQLEGWLQ